MFAMLSMFVFAAAAVLAVSTIAGSWRRHGAQAIALLRTARDVPAMREFRVSMTLPMGESSLASWPQLRRQPRRLIVRPAVRLIEMQRAAA